MLMKKVTTLVVHKFLFFLFLVRVRKKEEDGKGGEKTTVHLFTIEQGSLKRI